MHLVEKKASYSYKLQTVMQQPGYLIREILDLVLAYKVLDIGKRMGFTGYMDFININKNKNTSPTCKARTLHETILYCIRFTINLKIQRFAIISKLYTVLCMVFFR